MTNIGPGLRADFHRTAPEPAADEPPRPGLAPLREAGVPVTDAEAAFADAEVRRERRALLGFVRESRFRWSDVDPHAG